MAKLSNDHSILSPEVFAALQKHINLHRVLVAITLALYFIAWNRGLALLYGLFSLLMAVLLISYSLPYSQLQKINIQRRQVKDYFVNESSIIEYQFNSAKRRYQLQLRESLPINETTPFSFNSDRELTVQQNEITFTQRGCFKAPQASLSSAYPFGIFEKKKNIKIEGEGIIVFPKRINIESLPLPNRAENLNLGDISVFQKGGHDDFLGVRDYVRGDELNKVHWSASARQGQLIVKEYERYDHPAIMIVLNCHSDFDHGHNQNSSFEKSISLSAAIISFASRAGMQVYFAACDGPKNKTVSMTIPAMENDLNSLYEQLARIKGKASEDYQQSCEHALSLFPDTNLIFTSRLDEESTLKLPEHINHIDLVFEKNSFLHPHHLLKNHSEATSNKQSRYIIGANTPLETLFNAF